MVPLSEIKFTRCYAPYLTYGKDAGKLQYDVLLKSGPQFIVTKKEFDEINELIKYEVEDVYGMPLRSFNDLNKEFDMLMRNLCKPADRPMLPTNLEWPLKLKPFLADFIVEKVEEEVKEEQPKEDEKSSDRDSHTEPESDAQRRYRDTWF
jgi:hypothetical protein